MEEAKGSSSSSSATSARWNPTKEQIAVLEGLYRQGLRTPSAEEIQQITGKLREYGSIEGKNVFYWFQNHKARQRQRQKQESFAYFSRLVHHAPPPPPIVAPPHPPLTALLPSACTNVVCSPYCLPVSQVGNVGFHQSQYPNVLPPEAIKRKPISELQRSERIGEISSDGYINSTGYHHGGTGQDVANGTAIATAADMNSSVTHQTLELFPLHPTGILDEKPGSSFTAASVESGSLEEGVEGEGGDYLAFLNFFVAS